MSHNDRSVKIQIRKRSFGADCQWLIGNLVFGNGGGGLNANRGPKSAIFRLAKTCFTVIFLFLI